MDCILLADITHSPSQRNSEWNMSVCLLELEGLFCLNYIAHFLKQLWMIFLPLELWDRSFFSIDFIQRMRLLSHLLNQQSWSNHLRAFLSINMKQTRGHIKSFEHHFNNVSLLTPNIPTKLRAKYVITFFKGCPGWRVNLGSFGFCLFSLSIAAP